MPYRSFTIDYSSIGIKGGKFKQDTPLDTAKIVAKRLFTKSNANSISFCIRETTKDSKKKTYMYKAVKKMLKKPVVVVKNGIKKLQYFKISVKTDKKLMNRGGGNVENLIDDITNKLINRIEDNKISITFLELYNKYNIRNDNMVFSMFITDISNNIMGKKLTPIHDEISVTNITQFIINIEEIDNFSLIITKNIAEQKLDITIARMR
jgi:hypothetical protein